MGCNGVAVWGVMVWLSDVMVWRFAVVWRYFDVVWRCLDVLLSGTGIFARQNL